MLRVLTCITQEHDLRLVLLAGAICVAGSWIAIRLFLRARASEGPTRLGWLVLNAVAAGTAIWTTHFVAMLAFQPSLTSGFDPIMTAASLVVAISASFAGFGLATSRTFPAAPELGGALAGLGIGAMHFLGMDAYRISGRIEWDMTLVAASLAIGMLLASFALSRAARPFSRYCKYGAAAILTLAICGLHFTGMAAIAIIPDYDFFIPSSGISSTAMAVSVAGAAALIMSTGFASYFVDRRAREETERHIHHLAFHDSLTGLPNRVSFNQRLSLEIDHCRNSGSKLAVLCMDLDRFKAINDVFGHGSGDRLLAEAARRMKHCLRGDEFLARLGGDEFVAIQYAGEQPKSAEDLAGRLSQSLQEPFAIDGDIMTVGLSIGVAVFPHDGTSAEQLLAKADIALYRAKSAGRGTVRFFEHAMDDAVRVRRALSHELGNAVGRNELVLHYQVQKTVETGEICGFEALLRWHHPKRGLIPPSDFIPLAEETGLIVPIGEWVLRRACQVAASWDKPYKVAVNLSPVQLRNANLPASIHQILIETGLAPSRLEVEITESTLIENPEQSLHLLRQIKALGVTIAMDDFGTGYSSLSTLHSFPFDKIKLDRSFMQKVKSENQSAAIVRAVLTLGKVLQVPVLAEGVETKAHLDFLRAEKCDEVQGFLMGYPVPQEQLEEIIAGENASRQALRKSA